MWASTKELRDRISEVEERAKHNGLCNPVFSRLLVALSLAPDTRLLRDLEAGVEVAEYKNKDMSPMAKPDSEVDGTFRFGVTELEGHAGLNPEECHILIAGQTGTGKSTVLRLIFAQALQYKPG